MNSDQISIQLLQTALQAADLRQRIYANNIANIDTPGYKRQDVQFESMLQNALESAPVAVAVPGEKHIPIQSGSLNWSSALQVQPVVVQDNSTGIDSSGNNVDVDAEMARLAENQIRYNALTQDLTSRFNRLKTAINGG